MKRRTAAFPLRRLALVASAVPVLAAVLPVTQASATNSAPDFAPPFPCGQTWTYSHHAAEVRRALDFDKVGGGTAGQPVLASARGTATTGNEGGGAGQLVKIDHGGGWTTHYFHLNQYSVANGAVVERGQQIGTTGSTGNVTGPHIHYEQQLNGAGQDIKIHGQALSYPGSYGQASLTNNCSSNPNPNPPPSPPKQNPQPGAKKHWVDTFATASGHSSPGGARTGTLNAGTNYVFCKKKGPEVRVGNNFNTWWLMTDLDSGNPWQFQWVSAYYLKRWGNDEAKDNSNTVIPDCLEA